MTIVKHVRILPNGNLENARDELYCRVYAHTFDRRAGFKAIALNEGKRGNWVDTGHEYLKNRPHLKERIKVLVADKVEQICIDENWVMVKLVENLERAMEAEAEVGSDGEPTGNFKFDGRTATKVLEMIGGELGMFERNKTPQQGGVVINMNFGGDAPPVTINDGKVIDVEPA